MTGDAPAEGVSDADAAIAEDGALMPANAAMEAWVARVTVTFLWPAAR